MGSGIGLSDMDSEKKCLTTNPGAVLFNMLTAEEDDLRSHQNGKYFLGRNF